MADALEGLRILTDPSFAARTPGFDLARRQEALRREIRRNVAFQASDPTQFGTGGTEADIASLNEDLAANPYSDAAASERMKFQEGLDRQLDPRQQALDASKLADELKLKRAAAEAQGEGALAVEREKNAGLLKQQEAEQASKDKLYEALGITSSGANGGGGGGGKVSNGMGTPGTFKPTINAKGEVAFTQNQLPALVQRARDQLTAAREQTLSALQDAEKMYPGINDESAKADTGAQAPGWMSFLTGNAGKYGGLLDMGKAANDRLKYTVGVPTPFANMAQSASFANIEQMAGQLPGVRGLATITPLFKEHQSRWGKETPLATVQRLRHMARIMDDTLEQINSGLVE